MGFQVACIISPVCRWTSYPHRNYKTRTYREAVAVGSSSGIAGKGGGFPVIVVVRKFVGRQYLSLHDIFEPAIPPPQGNQNINMGSWFLLYAPNDLDITLRDRVQAALQGRGCINIFCDDGCKNRSQAFPKFRTFVIQKIKLPWL